MKKIYFLFIALAITSTSFAQTIIFPLNPGFETWRSSTSGGVGSMPLVPINAPTDWYGFDSLIIKAAETNLPLFLGGYMPTDLHPQVFQEASIKHGGSSAAKLVSVRQDTLGNLIGGSGFIAGSISNAQPDINPVTLAITYSTHGTPTTLRITSVSAWIEYLPGIDPGTGLFGGDDSGTVVVQAISTIGTKDSVVGTGRVSMGATPTYTQFTANVTYIDTVNLVTSVRIILASGQLLNSLDSSIMYVDDVSITGISQVPNNVTIQNANKELVKVYPNPTSEIIHLDGPQNAGLLCDLVSMSGQIVATKPLTGSDILDISCLPPGLYFYTISDSGGNKVQRGKVAVNR